jgi:integrase
MGRKPGAGVEALATTIRVSFQYQGRRVRETLGIKPTPGNLKAAARLVHDVKEQIRRGTFDYATAFPGSKHAQCACGATFNEYAEKWLALHQVEHSTRSVYESYLRVWSTAFGNRPINTITVEDIKRVVAERVESGVSAKGINNNLDPLRGVLAFAVESGALSSNPAESVKRLKVQKAEPDPFTKDEMESILAWMGRHAPSEVCAWYTVAFTTGLRPSEQCALRPEDIVGGKLKIERAFVRGKMKGTKTRRVRYVDLSSRAVQGLNGLTWGSLHTEVSLWAMHRQYWVTCLVALGIRHRSPYHTRHTYATVALMSGVNPAYISRQLGHSTMALLLSTYSRWIDDADGGAERAKVERAFCPRVAHD